VQPFEQKAASPVIEPPAPAVEVEQVVSAQSIPTIQMDLTPDNNMYDEEEDEPAPRVEEVADIRSDVSSIYSPESTAATEIPASASITAFDLVQEITEKAESALSFQEQENPFAEKTLTPPEELAQLQFLSSKSTDYQHQRPTTPDPIVSQPELAPIFGGIAPVSPAKPAPPRPPARGGSVLTTIQPAQPSVVPDIFKSDEFDDFSAKFESKTAVVSNAFMDAVAPEVVTAGDAWGDSGNAFGDTAVDDGFGNDDDGFDSWNVPVVPESTPYMHRRGSDGSDEGKDFSVVINPVKGRAEYETAPALAPPQKSPYSGSIYSEGEANEAFDELLLSFLLNSCRGHIATGKSVRQRIPRASA
jgi:hypothetical protein